MRAVGRCSFVWLLSLLMVAWISLPGRSVRRGSRSLNGQDLRQVLEAIHLTLDYMDNNFAAFSTPDALFSISISLGQMGAFTKYLTSKDLLKLKAMRRINSQLQRLMNRLTTMEIEARYNAKDKYEKVTKTEMSPMLDHGRWRFLSSHALTNKKLLDPYQMSYTIQALNEFLSDHCIVLLLGKEYTRKVCSVTDYCWLIMTIPSFSSYSSTHQLLYFIIAKTMNCKSELDVFAVRYNQPSSGEQVKIRCTNILKEAEDIASKGFELKYGDLFLEQCVLCGILGYKEFFRPDWLQGILSYQHTSGCFSNFQPSDRGISIGGHARYKRMDSTINDNCSTHFTSLAVPLFGQYIRYIIDDFITL